MVSESNNLAVHRKCPLCKSEQIAKHGNFVREYNEKQFNLNLSTCRQCSFVFLKNYDLDYGNFYDEAYLNLEGINDTKLQSDRLWIEARLLKIKSLFKEERPRILDFGIGDGFFLHVASKHNFDVYGFDINAASLEEAAQKYGVPIERLTSADLLPKYGDSFFDIVHANEVIEHLEYPHQFLQLAHKLLKPGGLLVVQTGNINSFAARAMGSRWEYIRPAHISYFSKKLLSAVVQENDFRIIYNRTTDVDWRSAARAAKAVFKEKGWSKSLGFLLYWSTCFIPQFRRTTLIYAEKIAG